MRIDHFMIRLLFALLLLPLQTWANVPLPFELDQKSQTQLSKTYKLIQGQNWQEAKKTAENSKNKDLALFVDVVHSAQIAPGKYDEGRLSKLTTVDSQLDTIKTAAEDGIMSNMQVPADLVIARYNSLKAEKRPEAIQHIRSIWRNRTMSLAEENKFYGRFRSMMTVDDNNKRMDRLLWSDELEAARRMLPRIGGTEKKSLQARLEIRNAQSYQQVKNILRTLGNNATKDMGVAYAKVLWMHSTKKMYKEVVENLIHMPAPQSHKYQWWIISRYYIRDFLVKDSSAKMHKMAYILASKYKPSFGPEAADGEWTSGWIALRFLNMPQTAYNHFTQLYNSSRSVQTLSRASYWAAMASKAMGNKQNELQWHSIASSYPTTFYGQISLTLVNKANHLNLPKYDISQQTINNVKKNKSAKFLYYASWLKDKNLANALMRVSVNSTKNPDELAVITNIPAHFAMPNITIMGAKLAASQKKIVLVNSLYPTHYMQHESRAIDNALRLSVIRQESSFDKKAASPAGAKGIMQLMPETAQSVANRLALKYSEERLYDPQYNMTLGSHYLKHALDFTDNNLIMSLVIYNAGPESLSRFVADYGDPRKMRDIHEVIDWIELIPFHETRNYVQRIVESVQVYRMILSSQQYPPKLEITKDLLGRYSH